MSTIAEKIQQASVAVRAAFLMSDPAKWCQGYWAKTVDGTSINVPTADLPELKAYAEATESGASVEKLRELGQALNDAAHWIESNSPEARQFCIEGACMMAAPNAEVGRAVIDALSEITKRDHEYQDSYGRVAGTRSAQSLNDSDGDDSRVALVQALLELADTLLNGSYAEQIAEEEVDVELPFTPEPKPDNPFNTPGTTL